MKGNRPLLILVFLAITLVGISYLRQKKAIDWRPSYSSSEKIPFGTFILHEQLKDLQLAPEVKNLPLSQWLPEAGKDGNSNLIIMAENPELGRVDVDLLLDFVSAGNTVFLAAETMPPTLLRELELYSDYSASGQDDTLSKHLLVNPLYQKDTSTFQRTFSSLYFDLSTSFGGRILGIQAETVDADFVSVPYGSGTFYLHLLPKAFTNIHILENPEYASRCLSYLPAQETFWDEYYKPMARLKGDTFQAIKDNKALSYAWKLILAGVVLGLLFYSKRKQRAIPVLPLPENKSLEFIETMGDLYLHNGQHLDLARKKTTYFYQHVRGHYHLNDQEPGFWDHLAMKSAADKETLDKIREMIQALPSLKEVSPEFLLRYNKHLENFYHQTGKYHTHE